MPTYAAPVRDLQFLFDDVLQIDKYANLPGFSDAPKDLRDAILVEGAKFSEEVLHPLNVVGDKHGCVRHDDGSVTTAPGFKDAYRHIVENGWLGLAADPEYGGQGLPNVLYTAYSEMTSSANMAFMMYPGLTHGAASAIHVGGSDEQKRTYLPKMTTGEWGGTMNLTEPHCGTDLGMLRSKAVPQPDGSYKITGQKIWISGGEHDLADNIIHLVLARIEGAPAGVKGISLFIVPKFFVNPDGSLGARNNVMCGGLEEKMGIHGNSTCVMNYDEATGWLIGEENKGLRVMFVMMNEARLGVGLQGLAQSEIAYQNAANFARDRIQGRSISGPKFPDQPADPIIVHPDVRRMLMDAKAFNEGARAFLNWTALHGDLALRSPDEKVREKAEDYMALLTPVLKAYLTEKGFENCSKAMQVHGGSGFTEEWGMSQFLRDVRIALIYEGTNGVQALDLVGRKLAMNGMRPITSFFAELDGFVAENDGHEELAPFVAGVRTAKERLDTATQWLVHNGLENPDNAGAASMDYLFLFGQAGLAYMWALMAKAALAKIAEGNGSDPFYADKLATGRYFLERILPDGAAHLAKVEAGAGAVMAIEAERF
ncbi:MAG: acyl-CoA dehydrogenase C-terminal domain-containing protein [Caulobacterales bacterium]|nr:acyl-CoA dehydrogenase C-terminal domain-containing protein [Caulobacterales bacterium]